MTTYNKSKSGDYEAGQLLTEINIDAAIVPSCLSVSGDGADLELEFAADLSAGEETTLDGIITAHVPTQQIIDVVQLPFSDIDVGKKLSVHPTYKPIVDGKTTYAVWCGAGDDISNSNIGEGDLLEFLLEPGTADVSKDMKFHPDNGSVWIHEGYLKFEGGGSGDHVCADFIADATPLQQVANLDLIITDHWVSYSQSGPGTGTHGFADGSKIALIPRDFSQDGDWDYDGVSLTPNFGGTGLFNISDEEKAVHRFINRVPCLGTSSTYFSMSSDETAELPPNYFIRIMAHNNSNTTWHAAALVEIYRERTAKP